MMAATFKATELRNTETRGCMRRRRDRRGASATSTTGDDRPDDDHAVQCLSRPDARAGVQDRAGGKTFVFCTDHELRHGPDPSTSGSMRKHGGRGALRERTAWTPTSATSTASTASPNTSGQKGIGTAPPVPKIDWGHGCIEDVVRRVDAVPDQAHLHRPPRPRSRVGRAAHHRPRVERAIPGDGCYVELAKPDTVIDL